MFYYNDIESFTAAVSLGIKQGKCNICGKRHHIKNTSNACEQTVYNIYRDLGSFVDSISFLLQKISQTVMQENAQAGKVKKIAGVNGINAYLDYTGLAINNNITYKGKHREIFKAMPYLKPSESFKLIYDFFYKNERGIEALIEECCKFAKKLEDEKYWLEAEKTLFNIIKSKEFQIRLINNLLNITSDSEIKNTYFYPINFEWPLTGLIDAEIVAPKKNGFSYIARNEFLGLDRIFESINMRQFIRTANVKFVNADIIDGGYEIALLIYPPETSGKPDINVHYKCSFLGEVTDIVWSEIPSSKEMTVH
jgi:hypothetical protein